MAKICVPVCVRRIDELKTATQQAARLGNVVELRLDCLEDPETALATHTYRHATHRIPQGAGLRS